MPHAPCCCRAGGGGLQAGRIKVHEDCGSLLVRLLDASREGQLEAPATAAPLGALRRPRYCSLTPALGPKHYATMCKEVGAGGWGHDRCGKG